MKKLTALVSSTALFLIAAGSAFAQDLNVTINAPANLKITDFGKLITSAIAAVLIISAFVAFAYLVWGGFQWITSGGDKTATEAARNRIQAAILGLFIVFLAWAIMLVLGQFLGFDFKSTIIPKPY